MALTPRRRGGFLALTADASPPEAPASVLVQPPNGIVAGRIGPASINSPFRPEKMACISPFWEGELIHDSRTPCLPFPTY